MPAVHSRRVHLVRVLGENYSRQDWVSATLYTLAKNYQFWRATRGDSQARHKTLWLVYHRPLKKWDLNEARHECRSYMGGSKVRRVFPSTFSLSPCLGFPWWECTTGITKVTYESKMNHRISCKITLQIGHRQVTCGSNIVTYGSQMNQGMGYRRLYMGVRWVTKGSHISHSSVALSNTIFLISKLTSLWPHHNLATFRLRKINVILTSF